MPKEQEEFQNAVAAVLEAVIFENWLRFYFIEEEAGGALKIVLPEKSMAKISELYPGLLPLAERLQNREIDFETSRSAVLTYVLDYLDGKKLAKGMAQTVFSSSTFQIRLQLFNTWVQMHEDQLDKGFMDFGSWLELFQKWLTTPGARDLAKKLAEKN